MKKILAFIFLISSFAQAQYTINGTMSPTIESDWVILYKIEGARQMFVKNSKIKIDTITIQGKKQPIGSFSFTLPKNTKVGAYRATYSLEGAGFIDFLFNNEDVHFSFHPKYPNQSVNFSASKENIIYKNYIDAIAMAQQKLDSIQVAAIQNTNLNLKNKYKTALKKINSIQKDYLEASKGMYVQPFITASLRNSPSEIIETPQKYMTNMVDTFFDRMDFNNKTLLNSSFLVDRITDYVFYINHSDDATTQQKLYKESITKVLAKIEDIPFKKDVIEFFVAQFENSKNLELIDFLLKKYNELPDGFINEAFINDKLALFAAEIGRIAPDFSWKEGTKNFKLSELKDAENYILVFWSTTCSHCLREIPELHSYTKENSDVKVIAFSLEKDAFAWKNYKQNLYGWHNVLGLNKWENKTARTYNIHSTPSYFILDANKKIIAKPEELKDVKGFFEQK
ncbi:TlpA family protein disulfide reductase [Polaribacter sp. Hel1_85]|uniref:TlpA family protein disulfide reductase n=1 Tax=Polaribacter sp. Hel1_85 TaxID=1250005 RepID=UPI00052C9AB6|nr:TlpA disulfide reductase family protein [Polaribacter sp. Hel1_85]KGL62516.1 thiol:disulfide interchange protein TlpA [Polaribacter sp. Hel1_85]